MIRAVAILAAMAMALVMAIPGALILAAMLGAAEPEMAAGAALVVGVVVMPILTLAMILMRETTATTPKAPGET